MIRQLTTALLVATTAAAYGQFSESFDDGAAAARWSALITDSEFGQPDGTVDYAFDYSAVGIPAAPGGGGTIGVQFFSNPTDNTDGDEGESVGIIANAAVMPAGDFSLSADVYFRVLAGSEDSATEYVTFGGFTGAINNIASAGLDDDVPARYGLSNGNGLAWQVTGDGGAATDIFRYEDAGNANAGSQNPGGSLDSIPYGTIPGVTTGAGNPNNPFEQYGFQNRWVTMSIVSTSGMISYKLNGVTLDTIDNTGGAFAGGSILIGLSDVFNSAAGAGVYTVFDNVKLTPEPTSAMMTAAALLGMALRRRV